MTFGFCSLLTTHENTKLTVMIQKQTQKRLRHNNDRKSQKRQKNWKSTRGVAPKKGGKIILYSATEIKQTLHVSFCVSETRIELIWKVRYSMELSFLLLLLLLLLLSLLLLLLLLLL